MCVHEKEKEPLCKTQTEQIIQYKIITVNCNLTIIMAKAVWIAFRKNHWFNGIQSISNGLHFPKLSMIIYKRPKKKKEMDFKNIVKKCSQMSKMNGHDSWLHAAKCRDF